MNPAYFGASVGTVVVVVAMVIVTLGTAVRADEPSATLPTADQLPPIGALPDPFVFESGQRVRTAADWQRRREELERMILYYEYGALPPAPGNVKGEVKWSKESDTGVVTQEVELTMGPEGKISTTLSLVMPSGQGPFPVIVKGDFIAGDKFWKRLDASIVGDIVKRGYALAEFDRTRFALDDKDYRAKGVYAVYPQADGGALAAWAWGYARVVDYLLTRDAFDKGKIIVTGHSRGGKAALLAGALDERVALTAPNGSGAGGAGCYRVQPPKTERLEDIVGHFPYWFGPRFGQFVGHVEQLPFDQHEVRALVAPRALFNTEGFGDTWANGPGTQASFLGAREVYQFLGATDKIGVSFRQGGHDQNAEDIAALLDFADHVLLGKPAVRDFAALPFPNEPLPFSWTAPTPHK